MSSNRLRERGGQIGKASVAVHVDRRIVIAVNPSPDSILATNPSVGSERIQEMRHISSTLLMVHQLFKGLAV